MDLLRELSTTAAASRTYAEFSDAILRVFEAYPLESVLHPMNCFVLNILQRAICSIVSSDCG